MQNLSWPWAPIALLLCAATPTPPDTTLVLQGGQWLDVRAGLLRPNGAIVVHDGRIVAMHRWGSGWHPPAGARSVNLTGRVLLPGLIDAHVHLTLAGNADSNARATLLAGFTTVVDLGSAGGAGVRLRDSIAAGITPGPTVIAAGSWIEGRRVRVRRGDGEWLRRGASPRPRRSRCGCRCPQGMRDGMAGRRRRVSRLDRAQERAARCGDGGGSRVAPRSVCTRYR